MFYYLFTRILIVHIIPLIIDNQQQPKTNTAEQEILFTN